MNIKLYSALKPLPENRDFIQLAEDIAYHLEFSNVCNIKTGIQREYININSIPSPFTEFCFLFNDGSESPTYLHHAHAVTELERLIRNCTENSLYFKPRRHTNIPPITLHARGLFLLSEDSNIYYQSDCELSSWNIGELELNDIMRSSSAQYNDIYLRVCTVYEYDGTPYREQIILDNRQIDEIIEHLKRKDTNIRISPYTENEKRFLNTYKEDFLHNPFMSRYYQSYFFDEVQSIILRDGSIFCENEASFHNFEIQIKNLNFLILSV